MVQQVLLKLSKNRKKLLALALPAALRHPACFLPPIYPLQKAVDVSRPNVCHSGVIQFYPLSSCLSLTTLLSP